MKYISSHQASAACFFCEALKQADSAQNLVLHRSANSFVILNRYPYTSGHVMVAPTRHLATLQELGTETRLEMIELVARVERLLKTVYRPDGLNIGVNEGSAAGAGVEDHLHFHLVPRWHGDTNFITTLAHVRVLPEALEDTYARLLEAWPSA